jgi:beta-N-acetylhexosaminidase
MRKALITGLSGPRLTAEEAAFLRAARPCGLILFSRNCAAKDEIRALVDAAREAIGDGDLLVLIDQEGGRVQRLRPPLARALPPAAAYGRLYTQDPEAACRAAFLAARLLADELGAFGINANCAPVLDLPVPGAHDVIGDRAYARDPAPVIALGRAVMDGLSAGGVLPIIKHIPGHGRATADSHLELPVVDAPSAQLQATDFAPFRALADAPAAMTAHVVFTAMDTDHPASTSERLTREVIRGAIGFDGLLMSDDLSMRALSGTMSARTSAVIAAGSDVALHCSGAIEEMEEAAAAVPDLAGRPLQRWRDALAVTRRAEPYDRAEAEAALARVLATGAAASESV